MAWSPPGAGEQISCHPKFPSHRSGLERHTCRPPQESLRRARCELHAFNSAPFLSGLGHATTRLLHEAAWALIADASRSTTQNAKTSPLPRECVADAKSAPIPTEASHQTEGSASHSDQNHGERSASAATGVDRNVPTNTRQPVAASGPNQKPRLRNPPRTVIVERRDVHEPGRANQPRRRKTRAVDVEPMGRGIDVARPAQWRDQPELVVEPKTDHAEDARAGVSEQCNGESDAGNSLGHGWRWFRSDAWDGCSGCHGTRNSSCEDHGEQRSRAPISSRDSVPICARSLGGAIVDGCAAPTPRTTVRLRAVVRRHACAPMITRRRDLPMRVAPHCVPHNRSQRPLDASPRSTSTGPSTAWNRIRHALREPEAVVDVMNVPAGDAKVLLDGRRMKGIRPLQIRGTGSKAIGDGTAGALRSVPRPARPRLPRPTCTAPTGRRAPSSDGPAASRSVGSAARMHVPLDGGKLRQPAVHHVVKALRERLEHAVLARQQMDGRAMLALVLGQAAERRQSPEVRSVSFASSVVALIVTAVLAVVTKPTRVRLRHRRVVGAPGRALLVGAYVDRSDRPRRAVRSSSRVRRRRYPHRSRVNRTGDGNCRRRH